MKWFVNSGWWLGNRHSRECRKSRCCHPGLRSGIGFIFSLFICSFLILTACSDYVSKIDDQIAELKAGEPTVNPNSSSGKVTKPAEVTIGSMTDSRDGRSYKTVSIGTQTWMAQNLNYETANSYCYSNTPSNCTKYGRLYTWAAAMDSAGTWSANGKGCGDAKTCTPTYPVRGVCPTGWHLPMKAEFETLFKAVGGSSTAGTKLKSTSGWNDFEGKSGNGVDAYSFSALPAGGRYDNEGYSYEGNYAVFWSSTEGYSIYGNYAYDMSYYMYLGYSNDYAGLGNYYKDFGFSVRCVKDE